MFSIGLSKDDMENFDDYVHVKSLKRSFNKLSNSKSGRSQNGYMHNFLVGVYHNYKMTLAVNKDALLADKVWDALWDYIAAKQEWYYIKVPYNQGSVTFKAYITSAEQDCKKIKRKGSKKYIKWGTIDLNFVACDPCGNVPYNSGSSEYSDDNENYDFKVGDI